LHEINPGSILVSEKNIERILNRDSPETGYFQIELSTFTVQPVGLELRVKRQSAWEFQYGLTEDGFHDNNAHAIAGREGF